MRIESQRMDQQAKLPDGRALSFAEYGDPQGRPVLYFHGWPGSRYEALPVQDMAAQAGVRVVALDRPGYGQADFQPGRRIVDWPKDIAHLAGCLGLQRFAVLGVSGGGPYALACAALLPDRVSTALVVCGVAPLDAPDATAGMVGLNKWMLALAHMTPRLARTLGRLGLRAFWRYDREVLPKGIADELTEADQQLLARPEVREVLLANWREAFRQGARGVMWDGCLYAQPWGFRLQDIRLPVRLWQGESDVVVPPAMGHYCAGLIPNCQATFLPQEGHFSLPFNHVPEILRSLSG